MRFEAGSAIRTIREMTLRGDGSLEPARFEFTFVEAEIVAEFVQVGQPNLFAESLLVTLRQFVDALQKQEDLRWHRVIRIRHVIRIADKEAEDVGLEIGCEQSLARPRFKDDGDGGGALPQLGREASQNRRGLGLGNCHQFLPAAGVHEFHPEVTPACRRGLLFRQPRKSVEAIAPVTAGRDFRPARSLADLPALLLGPPKLTLAVAESITCGRMQAAIGGVSGASDYFLGGITAYAIDQKVRHLGVDAALAERDRAVSAAVAAAMAIGACQLFGSDLAVATTGYAEAAPAAGFPDPGAFWAVAKRAGSAPSVVRHGLFKGVGLGRVAMQEAVVAEALTGLVDVLALFRAAQDASKFA